MPLVLLFISNLKHLISRAIIWFIIYFLVYYLFRLRITAKSKKIIFKVVIQKFFKMMLYVLIGFMAVAVSSIIVIGNKSLNSIAIFITVILICEGITVLIIGKDKLKAIDSIISTLMMSTIIIYSIY